MMEITNVNSLLLFILLFIPGLVSIKVYDLLIANEPRDFSKSFLEILSYGAINLAVWSWWIWYIVKNNFIQVHPIIVALSAVVILLLCPIIWSVTYVRLLKCSWLQKYIIHPVKRPWDWYFNQTDFVWVIVNLNDGTKIGGVFGKDSFASSFPLAEQLYLEEVWKLNNEGDFIKPVDGTKGILIVGKEINFIEFFDKENKQ